MAYNPNHYRANKEAYVAKAAAAHKRKLEWYRSLKSGPCTDCGNTFHPVAMEWDHLPGQDKVADISAMLKKAGRQTILDEIAKCELVCRNCHAIRTWTRQTDAG